MLSQDSVARNYFGMADNPVEHSRTKHIDIRHHFLRDHQQKGDIEVFYVSIENQLAISLLSL
jgi:hypothetical protein